MFEGITFTNGEAHIRDTGVTTKTITALIAEGKTKEEILSVYPQLEIDDLLRAFRYSMIEVEERLSTIAHEIKSCSTPIQGYSELSIFLLKQEDIGVTKLTSLLQLIIEKSQTLNNLANAVYQPGRIG